MAKNSAGLIAEATSSSTILLRDVTNEDLSTFFLQQLGESANHMAAFTAKDPSDTTAFLAHWAKILGDETIVKKTILLDGQVAGYISSFEQFGNPEVSYWIGRLFWGRGLATQALLDFLHIVKMRPLYARAVKDNFASLRVLEKCGFTISGHNWDFANARNEIVEEVILRLDDNQSKFLIGPLDHAFTAPIGVDVKGEMWSCVEMPGSAELFGTKKAVRVDATVDGVKLPNIGLMVTGRGGHMLSVSAKLRKQLGKDIGDEVTVHLEQRLT